MDAVMQVFDFFCLRKKFLLYNLISRNLKVKYRRSVLGVFWTILTPISSALVYFIVFKVVLKVQKQDYLMTILAGVLSWNYFSVTVSEGVSQLVDKQGLITKIYLPIQIFGLTTAATNLITLLFAVPVIMVVAVIQGKGLVWSLLLLPYFIACLFFLTYGCTMLVATAYVFFRDLRQIIAVVLQLMFYGTPILYTTDMVPENYRWILTLNPVGELIPDIQNCFVEHTPWSVETFLNPLLWALGVTILSFFIHKYTKRTVVESL